MSGFIAPFNHYFSNTCHDQDLCWVHRGGTEALYSSFPGAFRPVGETGGNVRRKCTFPERMGWGEDNLTACSQVKHGGDSAGIQTNPLQGRPLFRERGAERHYPKRRAASQDPVLRWARAALRTWPRVGYHVNGNGGVISVFPAAPTPWNLLNSQTSLLLDN